MSKIARLTGLEILDSRGRPTLKATCELESTAVGTASVPSGASTGSAEALELRDGDPQRYGGLGCRTAAANVGGAMHEALAWHSFDGQADVDKALVELDGTETKSRLGANAILAVSIAFARAVAAEREASLYKHLADLIGRMPDAIPRPTINLFSGGKHAGGAGPHPGHTRRAAGDPDDGGDPRCDLRCLPGRHQDRLEQVRHAPAHRRRGRARSTLPRRRGDAWGRGRSHKTRRIRARTRRGVGGGRGVKPILRRRPLSPRGQTAERRRHDRIRVRLA